MMIIVNHSPTELDSIVLPFPGFGMHGNIESITNRLECERQKGRNAIIIIHINQRRWNITESKYYHWMVAAVVVVSHIADYLPSRAVKRREVQTKNFEVKEKINPFKPELVSFPLFFEAFSKKADMEREYSSVAV